MKQYLGVLSLFVLSCASRLDYPLCAQGCDGQPYGIVEFWNFTDTEKTAFVIRIVDGVEHEALRNMVEAHTAHFYRLYPGVYTFGVVHHQDGKTDAFKATLSMCKVITVRMDNRQEGNGEERVRIRPRSFPQV